MTQGLCSYSQIVYRSVMTNLCGPLYPMQTCDLFSQRKLNVWTPSKNSLKPRYRISLFGQCFFVTLPTESPSVVHDDLEARCELVTFVSLSISFDGPHPHAATRSKFRDSRLKTIGLRLFGRHPDTGDTFDGWVKAGDSVLRRILDITDKFEDQDKLRKICMAGLERNLDGGRWTQ